MFAPDIQAVCRAISGATFHMNFVSPVASPVAKKFNWIGKASVLMRVQLVHVMLAKTFFNREVVDHAV